MSTYPWYFPPAAMLGLVTLARGIPTLADAIKERFPQHGIYRQSKRLALAALFIIALGQVTLFGLITRQMKIQEKEVEMGNRARIGIWLRENARPTESVYLEPLGYIGYFSGMRMIDYPGLVSPEVVRLRREKRLDMDTVIPEIVPDWVILRPSELEQLRKSSAGQAFDENYTLIQVFDVTQNLDRYRFIPGKPYVYFDASFSIFRRKT
jgi:hypothetical protein